MEVAPLFDDIADAPPGGQAFWRTCKDGMRIRIAVWKGGNQGTVFLFPGRTEYVEKYGPAVEELTRRGYCVLVVDWRGQGLSDRPQVNWQLGHVEHFSDYQNDVHEMVVMADVLNLPVPRILLAHSMGGAIGLDALHHGLPVEKAIFTSPMWGIQIPPHLRLIAYISSSLGTLIGLGKKFAPGKNGKNYVEEQDFEGNALTSFEKTYLWLRNHVKVHPELGLGGPSLRWLREGLKAARNLRRTPPPLTPSLCFTGTDENIVVRSDIHTVINNWDGGKLVDFKGARHEILMENEEILARTWSEIDDFLTP